MRHGGNLRWAADRYGLSPSELLDFSANINPLGPPSFLLEALPRHLHDIDRYPDPEATALRDVLARHLGIPAQCLRALNGGAEGLFLLLRAWRPPLVLLAAPSFGEYYRAAEAVGVRVEYLSLPPQASPRLDAEWEDRVEAGLAKAPPGTVLIVGNPNNPTGEWLSRDLLVKLHRRVCARAGRMLVDEAFLDFLPDGGDHSLVRMAAAAEPPAGAAGEIGETWPTLAVVGSLTKILAVPGLRLGYVVAHPDLLAALDRQRDPWSVNLLAQAAGVEALGDGPRYQQFVSRTRGFVRHQRQQLVQLLSELPGLRVFPGSVNFVLVETAHPWPPAGRLADALGRRGILIRDASDFRGLSDRFVRLAVRGPEDQARLAEALRELGRDCFDAL